MWLSVGLAVLMLSGGAGSLDEKLLSALVHAPAAFAGSAGRAPRVAGLGLRTAFGVLPLWMALMGFSGLTPTPARTLWLVLLGSEVLAVALLLFGQRVWLPPSAPLAILALSRPVWTWRRLASANRVMLAEFTGLSADAGLAPAQNGVGRMDADPADEQIRLGRETAARVRGLRRLVNAAIRSLPDPTVIVSLSGEIVLANQEARRLFGARAEVARSDVEAFFASSRPPPFSPESLALSDGGWAGERRGADGSLRDIRYVPWTDEGEETLGWVVRFADITAVRRAERAREEALQLLTHDMRAPQASILALVSRGDHQSSAAVRGRIAHYARRTIALADSYLQLARADAGGYDMRPVDLTSVMTEAVDELWALSQAKRITIRQSRAGSNCMVLGNHALLMRALTNLLDNAVKFSEPDSRIDCEVLWDPRPTGPMVVAIISDHGPGIAQETLDRLFQRFTPDSASTGGASPNVGLGLAFVQSVVEGHGGRVTCRSLVGLGATFDLEFPALRLNATAQDASSDRVHRREPDQ